MFEVCEMLAETLRDDGKHFGADHPDAAPADINAWRAVSSPVAADDANVGGERSRSAASSERGVGVGGADGGGGGGVHAPDIVLWLEAIRAANMIRASLRTRPAKLALVWHFARVARDREPKVGQLPRRAASSSPSAAVGPDRRPSARARTAARGGGGARRRRPTLAVKSRSSSTLAGQRSRCSIAC